MHVDQLASPNRHSASETVRTFQRPANSLPQVVKKFVLKYACAVLQTLTSLRLFQFSMLLTCFSTLASTSHSAVTLQIRCRQLSG